MIRCALTSCKHNNNGFCAKLQEPILDARGERILAVSGRVGTDDSPPAVNGLPELHEMIPKTERTRTHAI